MRIDKFLKLARIIKRRTVAKEACENGRVLVNGKEAKPGTEVEVGDVVKVHFGQSELNFRIREIKEHVPKDQSENLIEILE